MDPNQTLVDLRQMAQLTVELYEADAMHEMADSNRVLIDMAERFLALDAWMKAGGPLPDAWRERRGPMA